MTIKGETRLIDKLNTFKGKYGKYIPVNNQSEFEEDVYGIRKSLQLEFIVLEYIQKRLDEMRSSKDS